jgi:hypothetical protein
MCPVESVASVAPAETLVESEFLFQSGREMPIAISDYGYNGQASPHSVAQMLSPSIVRIIGQGPVLAKRVSRSTCGVVTSSGWAMTQEDYGQGTRARHSTGACCF